jgi:hypothetical protein
MYRAIIGWRADDAHLQSTCRKLNKRSEFSADFSRFFGNVASCVTLNSRSTEEDIE